MYKAPAPRVLAAPTFRLSSQELSKQLTLRRWEGYFNVFWWLIQQLWSVNLCPTALHVWYVPGGLSWAILSQAT